MEHKLVLIMIISLVSITALAIGGLYVYSAIETPQPQQLAELKLKENPVAPQASVSTQLTTPSPTTTNQPTSTPQNTSILIDSNQLYSLINAHRKEHKLPLLRIHSSLEQSASRKLQEMVITKYWQHENQQGVISWQVFEQSGYHYKLAGENLSFGNNSPWSIFSSWVASPEHNKQLLNPEYEDMGLVIDCTTYQEASEPKCMSVLHLGSQQY